MISQKKLEANRSNAAKSTGPTSDEGKATASRNSLKHGMYASNPLLPHEDPAEFQAFREGIVRHLRAQGPMELLLVDRIVCCAWRLRRIGEIENWIITRKREDPSDRRAKADQSPAEVMAAEFMWHSHAFEDLSIHEQRLQRSMQAALRQLMQLQKQARSDDQDPDGQNHAQKTGNEPTDSHKRTNSGDLAQVSSGHVVHSAHDSVSCPAFHLPKENKEYESSA